MPSLEDEERAVFPEVDDEEDDSDEVDDSEDEDDEDEDGEIDPSLAPPPPSAPTADLVTNDQNHPPNPNPNPNIIHATASAAENGSIQVQTVASVAAGDPTSPTTEERRLIPYQAGGYDDSRRLFQRLWTDEDELVILRGFLEFISQRGTIDASHQHDTGPFYEKIKTQLQLDFSKNQLIEKLRRMKKKFRNVVSRIASSGKDFAFKTPHEQATFEIARQIWSSALKRSREISDDEILNIPALGSGSEIKLEGGTGGTGGGSRSRRRRRRYGAVNAGNTVGVPVEAAMCHTPLSLSSTAMATVGPVPSMIEETVRSCLSPLFKELIGSAAGGGPGMNLMMPMGFWGDCVSGVEPEDEKWRKQRILELEVYLKRVELVQDQIKQTLEELRAAGNN